MTIVSTWKTILNDWQSTYYDSHTDQRQPVKQDDGLSVKFIVILVVVSLFACVIFCLLMAVLWKWISTRTKKKDENGNPRKSPKKRSPSSSLFSKPSPRSHVKLMRNDSSLSEIEVSRDSSLPPTPLSPLSEEDASLFPFERGRLEFSVSYDPDGECLKTTVVQAHDLPQRHCIFYVEGILLPEKASQQRTSIRYHNPSPIFEETFQFDLPYDELPERTLCFKVYEIDSFSQHLLIGHVLHSFDVEKDNYFNPMKMDLELMRGLPQDKTAHDGGELLMSLCYLPTAGRLTLVVLKCRLTKASNGLPSPFLKVSLILNRKQVKKIKTSVKAKTLNPVYNEAFIFDVPSQHISNVGLYTRVVNDRDEQELMGKVVIGPNSKTSMGIHHWECMLMSPRKPIAQWHTIM